MSFPYGETNGKGESGFGQRKRKNIKTVELSKNSGNREIFQVDRIMREREKISNEASKKKPILREIVSFGQSDSAQNFDGHVKKTSFYSRKNERERESQAKSWIVRRKRKFIDWNSPKLNTSDKENQTRKQNKKRKTFSCETRESILYINIAKQISVFFPNKIQTKDSQIHTLTRTHTILHYW